MPALLTYLAFGLSGGVNNDIPLFGAAFEVGTYISPHLAIHVNGVSGEGLTLFGPAGSYRSARAGIDVSSCNANATLCTYAGLEGGYAAFHDDDDSMPIDISGALGVLRGGIDIGGAQLRWRPTVEVAMSRRGFDGVDV